MRKNSEEAVRGWRFELLRIAAMMLIVSSHFIASSHGGVFLCFCQLCGVLTCRASGWSFRARFALPVASGVRSRAARVRRPGPVPGRGCRF